MDRWVRFRNAVIGWKYRNILKPLFFLQNPESVHHRMVHVGRVLGQTSATRACTRAMFGYRNNNLAVTVGGLHFPNPVGLSAGFDKQAKLTGIMGSVGFGFMEIGSVTGTPGPGNPPPRLWRLPKSKSLAVHYGLNSIGSQAVAARLRSSFRSVPLGISIAKANLPACDDLDAGIADYQRAAQDLAPLADYIAINISCPNTTGGEPFTKPENLTRLMAALLPHLAGKPAFIKLPADRTMEEIDALTDTAMNFSIAGFIISNLTTKRNNPAVKDAKIPPRGGLSGKVVEEQSNKILAHVYRRHGSKVALIGVGGIFSAEDAYKKIRLGASLVQLITGMIYEGPQLISSINLGLARLLQQDGFSTINEAVGAGIK